MSMPTEEFTGIFYMDFINAICQQRSARKYLEIGVQAGINLSRLSVDLAIGVDPAFELTADPTIGKKSLSLHRMPSDVYFSSNQDHDIDLAFLDGMHLFEFLLRDIYNTEAISRDTGLILLHDCLPFTETMIARRDTHGAWTGDVWKVVPILEKFRPDLKVVLIDCAPTGLVAISNLDPSNRVLKTNYMHIVEEFVAMPNDRKALDMFYSKRKIVEAHHILSDFNQSSYFKS